MRALRRPPPAPAEPSADNARTANFSRGARDAPEDTSRMSPYRSRGAKGNIPDLFDDRYSSDESDSDAHTANGRSREPPASSDYDERHLNTNVNRLDPPDEEFGFAMNPKNNNPPFTRGKSAIASSKQSRDRSNSQGRKQSERYSAKLLDDEEELYEQYQDELFHQQPYLTLEQSTSSQYGQFNIAPVVEMATLNGTKSKKKRRQRSIKESKNKGRYSQLEHDEDDVETTIERVLDTIPSTGQQQHKTHEEYYNFDESESDDDDEERPLRKSSSSSSLQVQRRLAPTTSRWEKCLNRTLVSLIGFLSIIFIRDHTPWWKSRQNRLAMQRYEEQHVEDPMKVYNTADDDSTHPRDHDPTNLYNKVTAGERISERPAKKSVHHGFMDENYENRPPAKNSGVATAKKAGVHDKNKELDKETEAFLASIKQSADKPSSIMGDAPASNGSGKSEPAYVKSKPQSFVPPPPPRPVDSKKNGPLYSSGASLSTSDWSDFPKKSKDDMIPTSSTSFGTKYTINGNDEHAESVLNMNDYLDDFSGTDRTSLDHLELITPDDENETYTQINESETGNKYVIDPEEQVAGQLIYSSSQKHKTATEKSLPVSSSSSFDQSMRTQDIMSVYKDAFYRWNHPFRHDVTQEINGGIDVPVFWRIPRSASGVVEAIMSYCYGLTLANALGAGFQDETLHTIKVPAGAQYLNVDVSTPKGIDEAAELGLVSSGLADAISSPFIYESTSLFKNIPQAGKCFTLLRHPVARAVSQYHFYQKDSVAPNSKQYQGMTIDEFAEAVAENNWMVRFLTGKRSGTLSWLDLEAAKEVFGRKCLVGLSDKAEESVKRYERFFRWNERVSNEAHKETCLKTTLSKHDKRQDHPTYEGSDAWEVLRKKNEYDVLLYEYATNLFSQQSVLYESYN